MELLANQQKKLKKPLKIILFIVGKNGAMLMRRAVDIEVSEVH